MLRFVVRRLVGMAFVLFVVSVLVFLIFNVIPNSPPAQRLAGKNATPQLVKSIEEEWGFDESLPVQYVTMMKNVFTGELKSYSPRIPVDDQIKEGIPATLSLAVGAAVIWLFFGLLLGYFSALHAGGALDKFLTGFAVAGISIPVFLLAPVLIYFLTYKVEIFPNGGYVGITEEPWEWLTHLILPWFTLAFISAAIYARLTRGQMIEAMGEDYIRTARAKGLREPRVVLRHGLRNALIPVVTIFGLDLGALLGGAVIAEKVFSMQGLGALLIDAVHQLDLQLVVGFTLFAAFLIVVANFVVDLIYGFIDPRVKAGV